MADARPMRSWPRHLAIAAVALAAALLVAVAQAPASCLADLLAQRSAGRLQLGDVSGTVWQGAAALILDSEGRGGAGNGRARLPGRVAWRIHATDLLLGSLHVELSDAAVCAGTLDLRLDRHGNGTLGAGRLQVPAQLLAGLGAPWNSVQPGGRIAFDWAPLQWQGGTLHGALRAEWTDASSRLSPIVPVGHYLLEIDGIYPGAQLRLRTLAGPMEVNGSGTIQPGNRLEFQGTARVQPGTDAAVATQLSGLISLLGPRNGDGAVLNYGI